MMEDYDLTKEDWDAIIEVGQFEGQRDPVASIPSKVRIFFLILNFVQDFGNVKGLKSPKGPSRLTTSKDKKKMTFSLSHPL